MLKNTEQEQEVKVNQKRKNGDNNNNIPVRSPKENLGGGPN